MVDLLNLNFDQFLNQNQYLNHLDDLEQIYIKHLDDSKSIFKIQFPFFFILNKNKQFLFTLQHKANALKGFNVRSVVFDKAPIVSRNFIYNCL